MPDAIPPLMLIVARGPCRDGRSVPAYINNVSSNTGARQS
jgi:hypothetical protein